MPVETVGLRADGQPGGRGARLAASVVDTAFFAPGIVALNFLTDRIAKAGPFSPPIFTIGATACLGYIFALAALQIRLLAKQGQTFGKRALKLQVVRFDGSPAPFAQVFVVRDLVGRGLIYLLPSLVLGRMVGLLFWLVDLAFVFRSDRRCLHDFVAGTRVIALSHEDNEAGDEPGALSADQ